MKSPENDNLGCTTAIFAWYESNPYGFFLTEENFEVIVSFSKALNSAKTWGEFWTQLSPVTRKFLDPWLGAGHHVEPEYEGDLHGVDQNAPLEKIADGVVFFYGHGLPVIQCARESYDEMKHAIPAGAESGQDLYEYDCVNLDTPLYFKKDFCELADHLERHGITLIAKRFSLELEGPNPACIG